MFDRFATSKNIAVQQFGTAKLLLMQKYERLVCSTSRKSSNFKNTFCMTQAKNVGRATFLDMAKPSNILLDKQI